MQEERKEITFPAGNRSSVTWLFEGIRMGHAVSRFKDYTSFSGKGEGEMVRLHYGLKGDYRFYYKQLAKSYDLIGSHHNIMYSPEFEMEVHNKTLELETFGVQFPKDLFIRLTGEGTDHLKRFAEKVVKGESILLSEKWPTIGTGVEKAIGEILCCNYSGELKRLFLLSKSLELLVLTASAAGIANNKNDVFIKSKADMEKVIAARDLINESLTNPPALTEIARSVGLNEYKLKRGFKEVFNYTVFEYLNERRLELARQLLLDTGKSVAQVATETGYATPQHFNNAFKKKFGITPNLVRKDP